MLYPFPADVRRQIDDRLAAGHYASEDDLHRDPLRALAEEDEDLRAVEEAVAELDSDPGLPIDEAFAALRRSVDNGYSE
jgi:Arc/MetJ-type ribon-helix-helix transcriptional regulator